MIKRLQSIRPLFILILTNLLGMLLIMIKEKQPDKNMAVLCLIMCVINIAAYIVIYFARLGDNYLFIIISMLSTIGIIIQTRINSSNGIRQMKLYLLGAAVFFAIMILYRVFRKYLNKLTAYYFGISMLLFIITAIFGTVRNGSKNWIVLGGVSIQPSEFIRILFVLSLASILTNGRTIAQTAEKEDKKTHKIRLLTTAFIAFANAGFLVLQREWGIGLLFFAIYLFLLYIYGEDRIFLFANIFTVIAGGLIGYKFMSHIQVRVATWQDPFADINGKGYQLAQSLFAIGSGGFTGSGIGNGSPYFIPVVSSDFIFSAICEEMGVLGGTAVILLYFLLVYRGFKIALSSTNNFHKAASIGLSVMLGVQTFIILGGVTKLIPLTGITLPFISYGGSSMITTFAALGILQSISSMKGEVTDEIE